jgi:hypothetical protein
LKAVGSEVILLKSAEMGRDGSGARNVILPGTVNPVMVKGIAKILDTSPHIFRREKSGFIQYRLR